MNRPLRVCARPGCDSLTRGRHCAHHAVNLNLVYGRRWREHVRPAVIAPGRCYYCGQPGTLDAPLHAAHLDETSELIRQGHDVYDPTRIVPAHQACHNAHAPHNARGGHRQKRQRPADIPPPQRVKVRVG